MLIAVVKMVMCKVLSSSTALLLLSYLLVLFLSSVLFHAPFLIFRLFRFLSVTHLGSSGVDPRRLFGGLNPSSRPAFEVAFVNFVSLLRVNKKL